MSGKAGTTKHSHIHPDVLVDLVAAKPWLREVFPIADASDMAVRWNA